LLLSNSVGPPTQPLQLSALPPSSAIANTGSTAHFFTTDSSVHNQVVTTQPLAIRNLNGAIMHSSHEGEIHVPGLPLAAQKIHIVPALTSQSLLSIQQLCDAGCDVTFKASCVKVLFDDIVVLQGQRTPTTRLWHLDLPASSTSGHAAISRATPSLIVALPMRPFFSQSCPPWPLPWIKGFSPIFLDSWHKPFANIRPSWRL
jgi:hypothetical protein